MSANARDVLEFWFGDITNDTDLGDHPKPKTWWRKSDDFDAEIKSRFGVAIEAAEHGELDDWHGAAPSCLAWVLLNDQFRRNVYRNDPRAFAMDPRTREVVKRAIDRGFDVDPALPLAQVCFYYLPLMHSESLDDHDLSKAKFEALIERARDAAPQQVGGFENNLEFEHKHRVIIERFGRYPHRNAVLGRTSTEEEIAFLKQPGSSF